MRVQFLPLPATTSAWPIPVPHESYSDGGVYSNNLAEIALKESRSLWPETRQMTLDVLLSLGTGHNGVNTGGRAEVKNSPCSKDAHRSNVMTESSALEEKLQRSRLVLSELIRWDASITWI